MHPHSATRQAAVGARSTGATHFVAVAAATAAAGGLATVNATRRRRPPPPACSAAWWNTEPSQGLGTPTSWRTQPGTGSTGSGPRKQGTSPRGRSRPYPTGTVLARRSGAAWATRWTNTLQHADDVAGVQSAAISTPPRKVEGNMHSIETGAHVRAYSRPALVPATLAASGWRRQHIRPWAARRNGLANAEDTVSTRPQQQHTPGGHLQTTVSDCHSM